MADPVIRVENTIVLTCRCTFRIVLSSFAVSIQQNASIVELSCPGLLAQPELQYY